MESSEVGSDFEASSPRASRLSLNVDRCGQQGCNPRDLHGARTSTLLRLSVNYGLPMRWYRTVAAGSAKVIADMFVTISVFGMFGPATAAVSITSSTPATVNATHRLPASELIQLHRTAASASHFQNWMTIIRPARWRAGAGDPALLH
ncbi:MAG: hypothetical protein M9927_20795 [Anaerolineae bacterium]|nr:hypothetical protein [Anaerolineae bacterium]